MKDKFLFKITEKYHLEHNDFTYKAVKEDDIYHITWFDQHEDPKHCYYKIEDVERYINNGDWVILN